MYGLLAIIRDEDETCQCFESRCERSTDYAVYTDSEKRVMLRFFQEGIGVIGVFCG